jgi:hypothetical protein
MEIKTGKYVRKIITPFVIGSLTFLAAHVCGSELNCSTNSQINAGLSNLVNIAQTKKGWTTEKVDKQVTTYSTLQGDNFVYLRVNSISGLDVFGYIGEISGQTNRSVLIRTDKDTNFSLDPKSTAFLEIEGSKRISMYDNQTSENVARLQGVYLDVLRNIPLKLDQTSKPSGIRGWFYDREHRVR